MRGQRRSSDISTTRSYPGASMASNEFIRLLGTRIVGSIW